MYSGDLVPCGERARADPEVCQDTSTEYLAPTGLLLGRKSGCSALIEVFKTEFLRPIWPIWIPRHDNAYPH